MVKAGEGAKKFEQDDLVGHAILDLVSSLKLCWKLTPETQSRVGDYGSSKSPAMAPGPSSAGSHI